MLVKKKAPGCCKNNSLEERTVKKAKNFLGLLSDENRLKILCVLMSGEKCVCDIYEYLGLSQNLTSYHLKLLERAGIIKREKRGKRVFYQIESKEIKRNIKLINNFLKV